MINKSPAFQFYPDDWNNDANVIAMSPEEEGHYIRLCAICWKEGSIPAEPENVQPLLKRPCEKLEKILKCFYTNPKNNLQLLHKRLEKERKKQKAWRLKSAKGGRKSRKPKSVETENQYKGGVRVVEPKGNTMVSVSDSVSISKSKDLKDIGGKKQSTPNPVDPDLANLWGCTLQAIERQIKPEFFKLWFASTFPKSLDSGQLVVAVPNQNTRKALIENYTGKIEEILEIIEGKPVLIDFCVQANT